jgi:hypothetical protein
LTQIILSKIQITSSQIWVSINGVAHSMGLFETSVLLSHTEEKEIKIISREYHKHNLRQSFENNFMLKIYRLLENANHNILSIDNKGIIQYPFWIIDAIDKQDNFIEVIIRNIKGEFINDN